MKRALLSIPLLLCFFSPGLQAQTLTMDEAIRIAQDSTIVSHLSGSALQQARWEYEQFLSLRRPQISFGLSPN